jgi:hypothetical protein
LLIVIDLDQSLAPDLRPTSRLIWINVALVITGQARLELPVMQRSDTMNLNEAIAGRRTIREYTAEAVEEQTIRGLIDAAGLGSGWIGFAQSYLNTPRGKQELGLPAACVPVAPIIVGRPTAKVPPVPRNSPTIHWID